MDGIQPLAGSARPLVATVHPSHVPAHAHNAGQPHPAATKAPSDYLRAIRRKVWLLLAVAIPVGTAGTLYVLRMPAVYLVSATIEIKAPKVDPAVARLVAPGDAAVGNSAADEKYAPNTLATLTNRSLLLEVVRDPALGLPPSAFEGDPAAELIPRIKTRQYPMSDQYVVTLEGRDPDQITRTLNILLHKFTTKADDKSKEASNEAQGKASETMKEYTAELDNIQRNLASLVKSSTTLAPGGRSLKEAQYEMLRARLYHDEQATKDIRTRIQLEAARPTAASVDQARASKVAKLEEDRKALQRRINRVRKTSRDPSDPAITRASGDLQEVNRELAELESPPPSVENNSAAEASDRILADAMEDINATRGQIETVLVEMKDAMPEYQKYVTLMSDRESKARQLAEIKTRLASFEIQARTMKPPVTIIDDPTEPTVPIKPARSMLIAGSIFFGLALGTALVCFLEHIDHSVKVPEHLTAGLALPLFGVVPRMRRNARNHRGGHLWTPGTPDSIEADAYRNLRASLLGATQHRGPIVTLLVTSAKAGEGKSTTALNLAATCARAGERTLLMDVDLRRPSLDQVFPSREGGFGLVDVLRGDLPWQRAVVQSDLPNLDFLPTGETRDVPIEVLGSLELRQLLLSLSQHHYDRVILDGPAVLGLADCRMLGRIVDAAMMVVRSGSQELRPLQRAKAMLEQSHVAIAGVVFNGLYEDLSNWSSYGPNPLAEPSLEYRGPRSADPARGLDDPSHPGAPAALVAAGPGEF